MIEYCKQALKDHAGDIVEIGAGNGDNTIEFLKIAKAYKRYVIVIDPFESGWKDMPESYGKPYPYEVFKERTKGFDNLIVHKINSLSYASEANCSLSLSFAFVDGLQYYGAVLNDLRIVSHAKVIAVDDYNRLTGESEVPYAVDTYIKQTGRKLINLDRWAIII